MDPLEAYSQAWLRWSPHAVFLPLRPGDIQADGDVHAFLQPLVLSGHLQTRLMVSDGRHETGYQFTIQGYMAARNHGYLPSTAADGDRIVPDYTARHPDLMRALASDA